MAKYRLLSDEELTHFEEEFKQFLIVNGVHAQEWEKLNREKPALALELVGLFSDQVLQRVYEKIEYLEKRQPDSCFVFRLNSHEMQLIAIQLKPAVPDLPTGQTGGRQDAPKEADLSTPESIHHTIRAYPQTLTYFKQNKVYQKSREEELHQLLEQGAVLSSREFWESLEKSL